jgi:hypothetical protein
MLCPRCKPGGGGRICRLWVEALRQNVYVCDECDALWMRLEDVQTEPFEDYSTFMRSRGLEPSWDNLVPIGPDPGLAA